MEPHWAFAHRLRGLAALAVLVFHTTIIFWQSPLAVTSLTRLPAPSSPVALGWWPPVLADLSIFNLGSFGVGLFFLISGFVIPYALLRQSRARFLLARVVRLWPTYAVGLSLTAAAIALGAASAGARFPILGHDLAVHYLLGLRDLTATPSLDGIVWTLEVEVRFYLLCALIAPVLRQGRPRDLFLVLGVLVLTVGATDLWGGQIAVGSVGWARLRSLMGLDGAMIAFMLVGTCFHLRARQLASPGVLGAFCVLAGGAFVGLIALDPGAGTARPAAVSYGVALVVFAAAFGWRDRARGAGLLSKLADISYPLYVVHAVPSYVLMRLALAHGWAPSAAVAAAWTYAVLSAAMVHRWIEEPTRRWSRRLASGPSPLQPAPAEEAPLAARAT